MFFSINVYLFIFILSFPCFICIRSLERFSNECRKTKTKVITLANQKGRRQSSKPIKRSRHKARGNVHARATIGFGFTSEWLKKWRENFEPITE